MKVSFPLPSPLEDLYRLAKSARENSYSPYSRHKVGAALRTSTGQIFTGCNIENSSYGATNCAERVAIQKAVSEQGSLQIIEILVVTDATPPWPPCGICRQVIAEFGRDALIHATNLAGEVKTQKLSALLPDAFLPEHLHQK